MSSPYKPAEFKKRKKCSFLWTQLMKKTKSKWDCSECLTKEVSNSLTVILPPLFKETRNQTPLKLSKLAKTVCLAKAIAIPLSKRLSSQLVSNTSHLRSNTKMKLSIEKKYYIKEKTCQIQLKSKISSRKLKTVSNSMQTISMNCLVWTIHHQTKAISQVKTKLFWLDHLIIKLSSNFQMDALIIKSTERQFKLPQDFLDNLTNHQPI